PTRRRGRRHRRGRREGDAGAPETPEVTASPVASAPGGRAQCCGLGALTQPRSPEPTTGAHPTPLARCAAPHTHPDTTARPGVDTRTAPAVREIIMDSRLRASLTELIGTFVFVFLAAASVCAAHLPGFPSVGLTGIALAQGLLYGAILTTTTRVSEGCLN